MTTSSLSVRKRPSYQLSFKQIPNQLISPESSEVEDQNDSLLRTNLEENNESGPLCVENVGGFRTQYFTKEQRSRSRKSKKVATQEFQLVDLDRKPNPIKV